MLNYLKESLGYKSKKILKKLLDIIETLKCSFISFINHRGWRNPEILVFEE
jgi:hypothetical protein